MSASQRRLAVVFDEAVWTHAVDGFSNENRQMAQSARTRLERSGVALDEVRACDAEGSDGTKLPNCVKLYLPWLDAPPSQRPFAFILRLRQRDDGLVWNFVAFGHATRAPACAPSMSARIGSCTARFRARVSGRCCYPPRAGAGSGLLHRASPSGRHGTVVSKHVFG